MTAIGRLLTYIFRADFLIPLWNPVVQQSFSIFTECRPANSDGVTDDIPRPLFLPRQTTT